MTYSKGVKLERGKSERNIKHIAFKKFTQHIPWVDCLKRSRE